MRKAACYTAFFIGLAMALGETWTVAWANVKDSAELSVEIKNRLYKTNKSFELRVQGGMILNHPYVSSQVAHGAAIYYLRPNLGLGADFVYAINKDKSERKCIENFYNTHNKTNIPISVCAGAGTVDDPQLAQRELAPFMEGGNRAVPPPYPNMGPAYPNIREINMILTGSLVWLPFYGKILLFMSQVSHFHTFLTLGGGITLSDFYPEKRTSSSGHPLRGSPPPPNTKTKPPGVQPTEVQEYGIRGRPKPVAETTPTITLGVGQKFHLTSRLALFIEGRSIALVGTENIYEVYFTMWGGAGLKL